MAWQSKARIPISSASRTVRKTARSSHGALDCRWKRTVCNTVRAHRSSPTHPLITRRKPKSSGPSHSRRFRSSWLDDLLASIARWAVTEAPAALVTCSIPGKCGLPATHDNYRNAAASSCAGVICLSLVTLDGRA